MPIVIAILTLMTQFEADIGVMKLKPFDVIIIFSAAYYLLLFMFRGYKISIPFCFLLLLPFFLTHVMQARHLGMSNVIREGIQAMIMLLFVIFAYTTVNRETILRYSKTMCFGITAILTYVVIWHLANGHVSRWKEFDDAKFAFTIFPIIPTFLALKDKYAPTKWTKRGALILFLYVPLVVLSGERKAALVTFILLGIVGLRGHLFKKPANIAIIFVGLFAFSVVLPIIAELPYIKRQIESVTQDDSAELVLNNDGTYNVLSPSNAQRVFAWERSFEIVHEYPFFGIGTNMYKQYIRRNYSAYPTFLKVEIHSEFQRALVELGIIGLLFYLLPLIRTFFFIARCSLRPDTYMIRDLGIACCVSFILIMATEGGGTQQFVLYTLLALFPDLAAKVYQEHRLQKYTEKDLYKEAKGRLIEEHLVQKDTNNASYS